MLKLLVHELIHCLDIDNRTININFNELFNIPYESDYKLNEAIKTSYEFVYDYFCDWYIEFTKTRFYGENIEDK